MNMGQPDHIDRGRAHAGKGQLPLRTLTRVDQNSEPVEAQDQTRMCAAARRNSTAGAEDNQFAAGDGG